MSDISKDKQPLRVIFMRHGKYSATEVKGFDMDGPLTSDGVAQVERTAVQIRGNFLDLGKVKVFCSPRARTQHSAEVLVEVLELDAADNEVADALDDKASTDEVINCAPIFMQKSLAELPEDVRTVILISHKPVISVYTYHLALKMFDGGYAETMVIDTDREALKAGGVDYEERSLIGPV